MSEVRLQIQHLSKTFGITKAVQDVSFTINKGEIHALIGENGSGKSTLTNMLTGIYSIDSGHFILDGKEIHPKNQVAANDEGVSIIVQELGTLSGLRSPRTSFSDMRTGSCTWEQEHECDEPGGAEAAGRLRVRTHQGRRYGG